MFRIEPVVGWELIQTVNLRIEYWNKSGTGIWGPVALASFWASAGSKAANLLADPRVVFDRLTGRFYVIMQESDMVSKSWLNVAVSKSADPVTSTTADWFFYRIENTEKAGKYLHKSLNCSTLA